MPVSGLCVDLKKLSGIQSLLPRILRQENKVDLMLQFTSELQKVCSLAQVTVYAIHNSFKRIFTRGISREHQDYIHQIDTFRDAAEGANSEALIAVCKES